MRNASAVTSVRFTPEAMRLLKELAKKLGVSQAAVIEMSVRKFAEREGVPTPESKEKV